MLDKIYSTLTKQQPARVLKFNEDEQKIVNSFFLITTKPIIYVGNTSETLDDYQKENLKKIQEIANEEHAGMMHLCAKIEEELVSLPDEERQIFMEELGIDHSGLDNLINASYKLLGLISFLTAGEKEVRAWTIKRGTLAPQAAGKIHTDFERGFIRAEIVKYADLVACGDYQMARAQGKIISAGKDYEMQDGDIVVFKFNV